MNDIEVDKADQAEALAWEKQRHSQRMQWVMLGFMIIVIGGFLTPLVVWLTRLALGG